MSYYRETARGPIVTLSKIQGGKCFYCKRMTHLVGASLHPLLASLEHRHPISRRGAKTGPNRVMACTQCNHVKGDMPEEEFLAFMHAYAGDIRLVTIEIHNRMVADRWEKRARDHPIPVQPLIPDFKIKPLPLKPVKTHNEKSWLPKLAAVFPKIERDESWKVHLWDLSTHTPVDATSYSEYGAKARAVTLASGISRGDIRKIICRVTDPAGNNSWMYQVGGQSAAWDWTPFPSGVTA